MRNGSPTLPSRTRLAGFVLACSCVGVLAGCGGSGGGPAPTPSPTPVTLMISSTANDQLQAFNLQLESLTLTSQSGKTIDIFSPPPNPGFSEFIHLNGFSEPLLTVSVPQDTYTSATATVGSAQFTCAAFDPSQNTLGTGTFAYGATPSNQVAVNVPQTIEVDSIPMGLSLNLQASPSATYGSCIGNGVPQYSIDPTFNLDPIVFGHPSNDVVGVLDTTLQGIVGSVDAAGSSFLATTTDGVALTVSVQPDTTFQNVAGLSALPAGTPVEMDLQIGGTGEVVATRVQLLDPSPTDVSLVTGAILFVSSAEPALFSMGTQQQGYPVGASIGAQAYSFGSATFQVSGYLNNLAQMPFAPVFNASTMVAGQNVAFSAHATVSSGGFPYLPATTVTLVPQTIDGIVTGIAASGSGNSTLTAYTVSLAPYDLFPDLALQPGQAALLTSPGIVTVYTLGGATGVQPSIGDPFRFTGLVFNDNGALKMDCLQILPGVPE